MPPSADWDLIVVGAGPAGCETARLAAAGGATVLVLEEHPVVGEPVQCAGLVARGAFSDLGLPLERSFHQNTITGAHIHAPGGRTVTVDSGRPHAEVVERGAFDRAIAARAEAAGAKIRRGAAYVTSRREPGKDGLTTVTIATRDDRSSAGGTAANRQGAAEAGRVRRETATCRLLVGADGVGSEVARTRGFGRPAEVVAALEVDLVGLDVSDPARVHVHVGRALAPGFFAWVVPTGRDGARIGLAMDVTRSGGRTVEEYYQRYLRVPEIAAMLADPVERYRIVGAIPIGLVPHVVADGVALVGDAGGFAKPTSGGGIFMGAWAAQRLAPVLLAALARDRTDRKALAPYARAVRAGIGRELAVGEAMRSVFRRLSDADLDRLVAAIDDPRVLAAINRHGDIDFPSRLLLPLLARRPGLLRWAAPALAGMVGANLRRLLPGTALARERRTARRSGAARPL